MVHNAEIPKNITSQQTLMFKYFQETLLKSQTINTIHSNTNIAVKQDSKGELSFSGMVEEGEATTFYFGETRTFSTPDFGKVSTIIGSTLPSIETVITTGLLKSRVINLQTEAGNKLFSAEHAVLHELAHGIMYVIMNEMKGQFNGIDFNKMTSTERSDWAIRYTNTLLQSQKEPLETGANQHNRGLTEQPPKENVEPLTK